MAKKSKADSSFDPADYEFTDCREQHVGWRHYDSSVDENGKVGYRVQKCEGCGTKRYRSIILIGSKRGEPFAATRYVYPPGYRVPGGLDPADRRMIRVHNFWRDVDTDGGDRLSDSP